MFSNNELLLSECDPPAAMHLRLLLREDNICKIEKLSSFPWTNLWVSTVDWAVILVFDQLVSQIFA